MTTRLAPWLAILTGLGGCNDGRAASHPVSEPKAAARPEAGQVSYLQTQDPLPRAGRCEAGACAWFEAREQRTIGSSPHERLVRITLATGSSRHPDGEPPAEASGAEVAWTAATPNYVLCSPWRSSVTRPLSDGGWEEVRVDFVTGSQLPIYGLACHPGEDWTAPGFFERNGYRPQPGAPVRRRDNPEDVTFIFPHDPQRPEQGGMAVSHSSPPPMVAVGLEPPPGRVIDARPPPERSGPTELVELDAQGLFLRHLGTFPSLADCERALESRADDDRELFCSVGVRSVMH